PGVAEAPSVACPRATDLSLEHLRCSRGRRSALCRVPTGDRFVAGTPQVFQGSPKRPLLRAHERPVCRWNTSGVPGVVEAPSLACPERPVCRWNTSGVPGVAEAPSVACPRATGL